MQEKNNKSPKRSDERKGSTRMNIRFEDDLLQAINKQLPDNPAAETNPNAPAKIGFSEWVKDACRRKLQNSSGS